ncbi:hypothetical protein AB0442_08255 [Kitasatospora sp. NPDC085895]|uniref:hypothetical protein n=1 Tax=Kitasatospora sp. NPDC085895 TaxID=3155057 RepID=UPI00344DB337
MNTALLPPPAPAPAQPPLLEWTVAFGDADRCVAEVRAGARAFLTRAHLPGPLREDALV